jgi:hypothetical protein
MSLVKQTLANREDSKMIDESVIKDRKFKGFAPASTSRPLPKSSSSSGQVVNDDNYTPPRTRKRKALDDPNIENFGMQAKRSRKAKDYTVVTGHSPSIVIESVTKSTPSPRPCASKISNSRLQVRNQEQRRRQDDFLLEVDIVCAKYNKLYDENIVLKNRIAKLIAEQKSKYKELKRLRAECDKEKKKATKKTTKMTTKKTKTTKTKKTQKK